MIRPAEPAPASAAEAFRRHEGRVVGLVRAVREKPEAAEDLATLSQAARQEFVTEVAALPSFAPEAARRVALQALAAGLLCGSLDGVLLMETSRVLDVSCPGPGDAQKLQKNLEASHAVARDSWAQMGADDLQLLSGYGKHQNLGTAEEAVPLAGTPEGPTFLLATFKAGYALGLIDATLVSRTGEAPGQAKA